MCDYRKILNWLESYGLQVVGKGEFKDLLVRGYPHAEIDFYHVHQTARASGVVNGVVA